MVDGTTDQPFFQVDWRYRTWHQKREHAFPKNWWPTTSILRHCPTDVSSAKRWQLFCAGCCSCQKAKHVWGTMTLTMAAVSIAVVAIGARAAAAHNRGASNWVNCRTSSQSLVLLPHRRSSLVLSARRRRAVSWLVNQRAVVLRSQNNKRSGSYTDCSSKAAFRLGVRLLHALGSGVLDSFSGSVGCDPLQEDSLFQLRPTVHGRHDEQRKRFFISMVFETNHRCYLRGHAWRT